MISHSGHTIIQIREQSQVRLSQADKQDEPNHINQIKSKMKEQTEKHCNSNSDKLKRI